MHQNPVEAGLVYRAEDYRYSSAIDYANEKGLLDDIVVLEYLIYKRFKSWPRDRNRAAAAGTITGTATPKYTTNFRSMLSIADLRDAVFTKLKKMVK